MRFLIGFFVALLFPVTSVVFAQDLSKADVVRAIESFAGKDVVLSGEIAQESPDKAQDQGAAGVVIQKVVIGGSDGSGRQFTGNAEIAILKNGTLVLVSKEALPGIKLYKSGETLLCNQTHTEDPMDPKRLVDSLRKLGDWKSLAKAISESAKVRVSKQGTTSDVRIVLDSAFLGKEEVNPPGGVAGGAFGGGAGAVRIQVGGSPLTPSVVDLIATFHFDASKELAGITYEIQYDDPMKAMMSKAMIGGGGAFRIQGNAGKPAKDDEVTLGSLTRMDFDIQKSASPNLGAFAKEAEELLRKK